MQLPTKEQYEALHWANVRSPSSRWRGEVSVANACEELGWLAGGVREGGDEWSHCDYIWSITPLGREALQAYRQQQART